jgi:hypothetical protein
MKIQEMRPGVLHLNRRVEAVSSEGPFGFLVEDDDVSTLRPAPVVLSELDRPQWSVVSFDRHEADALTYRQAAEKLSELDARGISGLCIVTDEAALRIKR